LRVGLHEKMRYAAAKACKQLRFHANIIARVVFNRYVLVACWYALKKMLYAAATAFEQFHVIIIAEVVLGRYLVFARLQTWVAATGICEQILWVI